jgi:hypothetical protein
LYEIKINKPNKTWDFTKYIPNFDHKDIKKGDIIIWPKDMYNYQLGDPVDKLKIEKIYDGMEMYFTNNTSLYFYELVTYNNSNNPKELDEIKVNKPGDLSNPISFKTLLDKIPNEKYFPELEDYEGEEQWGDGDLVDTLYYPIFDEYLKGKPGIKGEDFDEWVDIERGNYGLGPLETLIINKIKEIIDDYRNQQEELGEIQIKKPTIGKKWTNQTLYDALINKGMDLNAATIWDESNETNILLETYEAYSKEEILKYIKSLGFQVLESTTRQNTIPSVHGVYFYEWYITCENPNPEKPEIRDGNDLWELIKPEFELDIKELLDEIQVNKPDMFKSLVKSYTKYLESISRAEMFDENGNYNPTLKDYHNKLHQYVKNGTEKEQEVAGFILSWI